MGQKSNPVILRLNKTNQHWDSSWYSDDNYATPFLQDCKIRAYIKSSQQQLERFPPVFFVKRQRGDLQIALFSAKPARQFTKFKRHKNFRGINSITHNILKESRNSANVKKTITGAMAAVSAMSAKKDNITYRGNPRSTALHAALHGPSRELMNGAFNVLAPRKKEYFRKFLFLVMISRFDALLPLKGNLMHMFERKAISKTLEMSSKRIKAQSLSPTKDSHSYTTAYHSKLWSCGHVERREWEKNSTALMSANSVRNAEPRFTTRDHMEYSIYKYYNYRAPFASVRDKLYLIKSPSIYQNPLFLASQVVSLLEERAVFRQIKHRVIREIQRNPIIRGVRIVCSGRVASRSKKAQKARRESIQWGVTSLNVFSEHVNFAHSFAQTAFGKIGVKVWISYEKG